MISGNTEKFKTPLRQISGKVELLAEGSAPATKTGNFISIDDACVAPMNIQLSSETITDFSHVDTLYSKNILDVATAPRYHTFTNQTPMTITRTATGFTAQYEYAMNSGWTRIGFYIGKVEDFVGKTITFSAKCRGSNDDMDMTNLPWLTICGTDIEPCYTDNLNPGSGYVGATGTRTAFTQTSTSQVGQPITYTFTGEEINKYVFVEFLLTYGKPRAIGDIVEYYDIQVEYGDTGTDYEPYYALPIPAKVKRTGKNLWDFKSGLSWQSVATSTGATMARYGYIVDLPPGTYNISASLTGNPGTGNCYIYAYLLDETNTIISSANHLVVLERCYSYTITIEPGQKLFVCDAGHKVEGATYQPQAETLFYDYANIQIERGSTKTDYEPYKEVVAEANENGLVEMTSCETPFNLYTTPAGITMETTYQKKLNSDNEVFTHDGDLISFEIERAAESKFFGFGISQKIDVKVRDKDRIYNVYNTHHLRPYLDDMRIAPDFYVKDIERDENTNDLSITAYDAIEKAAALTWDDLTITDTSIGGIATAIGLALGVSVVYTDFKFGGNYGTNINVEGTETLREVLDDIAEATQTIYFINHLNELVFVRLDASTPYVIDKSQYFTLKSEPAKVLTGICSATELGDNVEANDGSGETQYVRDNIFWTADERPEEQVEWALDDVGGTTITPFDCSWRGCYLLEPGDCIEVITKDDDTISTFLLNDTLTYNGGLKQHSQWAYESSEKTAANPSTLGERLKQTFAKVDKANKQLQLVASETQANAANISELTLTTSGITATVSSIQETTENLGESITDLSNQVSLAMTDEQVEIKIQNKLADGVDKVITKEKNYTFDDTGLSISSSENNITTTITEDGMTVSKSNETVLTANNEGVQAIDLHARTYLIIGENSRFEDFGSRSACFWIGG